jgi:HEPN domain-containing protein
MDVEVVREWLDQVEADLDAAWSCVRGPRASPTRAAYFVQQAAEKLVKAVLIACRVNPPRVHDIERLVELLPNGAPKRDGLVRLERFTVFAFAFRYPGEDVSQPLPTSAEIDRWIAEIEALKSDFERWLEQRAKAGEAGGAP